jgi:hypothetical protein
MGAIKAFVDSYKAGADLSAKQYYAVELTAANTVNACSAAADRPIGILQNKPRANEAAAVCHSGRTYARADGGSVAIAVGDLVGPAAGGKLIKKATADFSTIGTALSAAAADDMLIEVLLGAPGGGVFTAPAG